jgi:hypothetical protein
MDWKLINEERPVDGQRCLICNKHHKEVTILTYNGHYECWDDIEGDDFYCDLDQAEYWIPLPDYKE